MGFTPSPLLVALTSSHTVPDEHVAVVTLVTDQGVVRDGGVHGTPILGIVWDLTLDG